MSQTNVSQRESLARRVQQAFLDHGYEQLTMSGLAKVCGFSRRALYHHFSNKEDAFRFGLRQAGEVAINAGIAAGRSAIAQRSGAVDVFTEIMDVRYGENRRLLARSPHALEVNDQAFRRARDIMIEAATDFQDRLAKLIVEMAELKILRLKPGTTAEDLAQSLCDGARGSNQALPPISADDLPTRYRRIIAAILYGVAEVPAGKASSRPGAAS